MKHHETVYYHRIILPCVFSELNPVSLLVLNFYLFGHSKGTLSHFEITRASVLFFRKFQLQFNVLRK